MFLASLPLAALALALAFMLKEKPLRTEAFVQANAADAADAVAAEAGVEVNPVPVGAEASQAIAEEFEPDGEGEPAGVSTHLL